jgi:hypothetical protein
MENEIITYFLPTELLLHFDILSIRENGDTKKQLLARSIYIIAKKPDK